MSLIFCLKEMAMSNFAWLAKARVKGNPGLWVRGGIYADYDMKTDKYSYYIRDFFTNSYPIDETSICYCSGLMDRNGILIFVGDRIFIHDHLTGEVIPHSYVVGYDSLSGQFVLADEEDNEFCYTFYDVFPEDCEVAITIESIV